MLGAIAGDILGAAYEARPIKREDLDLFDAPRSFPDDTVLTVATADAILMGVRWRFMRILTCA
jgi:ADP-ribosylglycohydrolase